MKRYGIWCQVWGGVTGHRQAWAKQCSKPLVFSSFEAAQAEAAEMMCANNGNPHRVANFSYVAKELTGGESNGLHDSKFQK